MTILIALTASFSIVAAVIVVLDIIAIITILAGDGTAGHKLLWTVLVLVLPLLGMMLYFVCGRGTA